MIVQPVVEPMEHYTALLKVYSSRLMERPKTLGCDQPELSCSHVCVNLPPGGTAQYKCLCPDGMKLDPDDGHQCLCPVGQNLTAHGACKSESGTVRRAIV